MQHHTHLTRPPHVRAVHTNNIQIHPVPVPPTQLPQKLPQTSNTVPQSTGIRDPQNRLNKPPLATTIPNQTTQMQKIRQQHQHLSFKNNNNHHNNNNNNNSYQQYNPINVQTQQQEQQPHMGVLQQQQQSQHQTAHRNVPPMHHQQKQQQHSQQQHNVLHMKNPLQHQQQQQHQLQQQQQQYQTYGGYGGNKNKYGNNNSSSSKINNINNNTLNGSAANCSTPKTILQNPNRLLTKSTPTTTTQPKAVTTSPPKAKTNTNEVVAIDIVATVNSVDESSNSSKSINNPPQSAELSEIPAKESSTNVAEEDPPNEANKENNLLESQAIKSSSASDSSTHQLQNSLLSNVDLTATKNSKDKTPMCLVNELARFNKITHQYRLTGEKGPAHCKRFTVTLKLGNEEYTAEGFKIKKAQHLAAAQAIEKTAYKHPIPKGNRNNEDGKNRPYIMPTVELNALAMKLGQPTYYLFDPRQMPPSMSSAPPADLADVMHDGCGIPTHHYGGPRPPMPHPTSALGLGGHIMPPPPTHSRMMHDPPYGARRNYDIHGGIYPPPPPPLPPPHMQHHNQRSYLPHRGYSPMHRYNQRYPLLPPPPPPPGMPPAPHHMRPHFGGPTTPYKITLIVGKQKFVGVGRTMQQAKHDAAARALQVLKTKTEDKSDEELDDSIDENDAKSPISQVHEAAVKRNMQVHFKIMREEGPAHMRKFITACIVGSTVTEGEGHGKKISKKRSAEKMLIELEKLPPLTPIKSPIKRIKAKTSTKITLSPSDKIGAASSTGGRRGKRYNLLNKSEDIEKGEDDDENPITKLIRIQQNLKDKDPIFELVSKNGNEKPRRREIIVEVTAQGKAARGTGKNKKLAKQNAAENLLKVLAEAAKNKSDENASLDGNKTIVNTSSSSMVNAGNLKENVEHKSTNSSNEQPRISLNTVKTADIPIVSTTAGQVPGILILRQNKKSAIKKKETTATNDLVKPSEIETTKTDAPVAPATTSITDATPAVVPEVVSTTPTTKQEIVTTISTPLVSAASNATTTTATANTSNKTVESSTSSGSNGNSSSNNSSATPMMKHQLLYLAKLLGFEVDFSDYPKGNHNEFLTIVTLSTDPPQICHGFGVSTNESQNDAARNALKILSDLGLNNAKSN